MNGTGLFDNKKEIKKFLSTEPSITNKSICSKCWMEDNIIAHLVEYPPDPHDIRKCPPCLSVISQNTMRFESRTEPLGSLTGKQPTFEAALHRKRTNGYGPTEEPIPKFGNFEDTDLKLLEIETRLS